MKELNMKKQTEEINRQGENKEINFQERYEKIKNSGMTIDRDKVRESSTNVFLVAVVMRTITKSSLKVAEGKEEGSHDVRYFAIATEKENMEERRKSYEKKHCAGKNIEWTDKEYENKEDDLQNLFDKLNLTQEYQDYKGRWTPDVKGMGLSNEEAWKGSMYFKMFRPYENEKGQVLIAEDYLGNKVWVYALENYSEGTVTYRVFMEDRDGRPKPSKSIPPSAITIGSSQISNLLRNYNAKFTTTDILRATEIMWLYDLCRPFKAQRGWEKADPLEVYEGLKKWIIANIGATYKFGREGNERDEIPVYCERTKDRIDVGIWQKSFDWITQELFEDGFNQKEWLRDATNHGWIIPSISSTGQKRNAFNPSEYQRELYSRENKSERVYRFQFSEEELKDIEERRRKSVTEDNSNGEVVKAS